MNTQYKYMILDNWIPLGTETKIVHVFRSTMDGTRLDSQPLKHLTLDSRILANERLMIHIQQGPRTSRNHVDRNKPFFALAALRKYTSIRFAW